MYVAATVECLCMKYAAAAAGVGLHVDTAPYFPLSHSFARSNAADELDQKASDEQLQ